jgi:hypothetical protein
MKEEARRKKEEGITNKTLVLSLKLSTSSFFLPPSFFVNKYHY